MILKFYRNICIIFCSRHAKSLEAVRMVRTQCFNASISKRKLLKTVLLVKLLKLFEIHYQSLKLVKNNLPESFKCPL